MQRHLLECDACARHDTAVRRGLLIFRNLPPIEPSPHFAARLEARIARAREEARLRALAYGSSGGRYGRQHGPSARAFAAAAAGVMAAGYLAILALDAITPPAVLALAPVVATAPEPGPAAAPAYVTSFSAGMPLWPAALVAGMAPVHFANMELRTVSLSR